MLERAYRPKMQKAVTDPLPPNLQKLLTTIDADLIVRVMERGMHDQVRVCLFRELNAA